MRPWRRTMNTSELKTLRWALSLILVVLVILLGRRVLPTQDAETGANGLIRGTAHVVDGDSLNIGRSRIRLVGIDAPEGPQTCKRSGREWDCGEDARRHLAQLIAGQIVSCRVRERDKHARALAVCSTTREANINAAMVASGFAISYGNYRSQENDARAGKRGLWSGEFQNPRDWRHERGIGG